MQGESGMEVQVQQASFMCSADDSKNKRAKFSQEEDEMLIKLIKSNGAKRWKYIAQYMPSRTARQCRDRYANYLMPNIENLQWTDAEDKLLIEKYAIYGPKWSQMRKFFSNRSTNNIKNRWYVHLSRMSRECNEVEASSPKDEHPKFPLLLPYFEPTIANSIASGNLQELLVCR